MFNDQLLSEYADTFLGYGNQNGKFCFIGLEEGIGGSFEDCFKEVNSKITSWEKRGKKQKSSCCLRRRRLYDDPIFQRYKMKICLQYFLIFLFFLTFIYYLFTYPFLTPIPTTSHKTFNTPRHNTNLDNVHPYTQPDVVNS